MTSVGVGGAEATAAPAESCRRRIERSMWTGDVVGARWLGHGRKYNKLCGNNL